MRKLKQRILLLLLITGALIIFPTGVLAGTSSAKNKTLSVGNNVSAVFDENTGVLTLYSNGEGELDRQWAEKAGLQKDTIKQIKVRKDSGTIYLPKDSHNLFSELTNLSSIDTNRFNSSRVTNMGHMFYACDGLTELNLSGFDTSQVTDMRYMFSDCVGLTKLDISGFDTSRVTDMSDMFANCRSLNELDLSNFDTSQVTDMRYMFARCSDMCSGLTELDLSSFDTSQVTDMRGMFANCRGLTELNLSSFDTSQVTDMGYMFIDCLSLTKLDFSSFDTSQVTDMRSMFSDCSRLIELDLSSFDTSQVTDMRDMFDLCSSLTELDLSSFDTSQVTDMGDMFDFCDSLKAMIAPHCISTAERSSIELPIPMYDQKGNKYRTLSSQTQKSLKLVAFRDLEPNAWYFDSVYWAVKNGVTSGTGKNTFSPTAKLTRAQAITFLYNLVGKPNVSELNIKEFSDVPVSAWYHDAVKWAVANKITSGYGAGTFRPNEVCSRAMTVAFLMNYAKATGTYKEPTTSSNFKDVASNAWYKSAVDWAVENKITSGYGANTFQPNAACNRVMMVSFLQRIAVL